MGEGPEQRATMAQSLKGSVTMPSDYDWPRDENGKPMIKVSCGAAELIPTVQYGNVTVGPVIVTCFVPDRDDDADLLAQINRVQSVCERAVADERQTVAALMRSRIDRPAA